MKFSAKVGNEPMNKRLNFGSDQNHRLDSGTFFRIPHYWEIQKVANGHKSAAHTDSQDCGTLIRALAEACTVPVQLRF